MEVYQIEMVLWHDHKLDKCCIYTIVLDSNMSVFLSTDEKDLLKWVKDNKAKIETATVVEKYDDSELKKQVLEFDDRLKIMEKEEEKEKPYFERVEKSVNDNKRKIEGFTTVVKSVAKSGSEARKKLTQEMKSAQELTQAMKLAQDKQQKEITKRMEAMRKSVEESLEAKFTERSLLLDYKESQINKKGLRILSAQEDAYLIGNKTGKRKKGKK